MASIEEQETSGRNSFHRMSRKSAPGGFARDDHCVVTQVDDQRRQIETLEKENQVLKVILQEKNKI